MPTALVTGAGRGIGLAITHELLDRGYGVFATARNPGESSGLDEVTSTRGDAVRPVPLDVTDEESIERAFDEVAEQTDSLDLLVNNAGVASKIGGSASTAREPLDSMTMDNSLAVFAVNTVGPLLVTRRFLGLLKRSSNPRILNVTSRMGSIDDKSGSGYYSYSASKAALNMATKILSHELRSDGVIAVVAHPGWVRTDMGGSNATLSPGESAAGLIDLTEDLRREDSGAFFNYDGSRLPW